ASYWRCKGLEGSSKKRRQKVSSITGGPSVRRFAEMAQLAKVTRSRRAGQGGNTTGGTNGPENSARRGAEEPPTPREDSLRRGATAETGCHKSPHSEPYAAA